MPRYPWLCAGIAAALGAAAMLPSDTDRRVLLACGLAALCAWMLRHDLSKALRACVAAALVAGALSSCVHAYYARLPPRAHTTRISCTVSSDAIAQDFGSSYACDAEAGGTIAVTGTGGASIGEHVLVRGRLEPFDRPRNPGEPDEREIEGERGFVARMSGAHILRRLPPARQTLALAMAGAHAWALTQLRARLPEPSASILAGELWGERSALPPNLRAEFQETGTVHILVTAGLHLGVVAGIVFWIVRACRLARWMSCAVTIASVWAYAAFSGMHVPAMRAAAMISFGLAAYAAGAAPLSWNAYGAALLAIAICDPRTLGSASFVLSFSCVGAILLCAGPIGEELQARAALPRAVREAFALTIATQLGTWPQTAAIFLLFAPYAIAANVLVVPAVGATMVLGGVQLALAAVPALAQAAANLNAWLLAWIVGCVQRVADLPGAAIPMTPAPAWALAAYDALLVAAVLAWQRSARTAAIAFFATGIALVVAPPVIPQERLRIVVLDVGQADGIVVRTPLGHTILVDAGGRLERGAGGESTAERVGELTVVPFLRRAGVRAIDAIVLSHPHGDHAGGAAPALRAFHVDEFADSGQRYGGYAYNDALQTAQTGRVPIVYPRAGTVWRTDDGVTLAFLGPSLPLITGSRNDINNNSIAFVLQYKHFRMLFTGDAGAEAEERFLREGIDLRADVLKVGHHGSAYSSTPAFIAAVHPRYAIVSVGRHNMFGHPALQTLDTLRHFGAQIYRTDEDGAVTITSDGGGPATVNIATML